MAGERAAFPVAVLAATRTEQQHAGETGDRAHEVDGRGSREVLHSPLLKEAAAVDPVRRDRVNDTAEQQPEDDVRTELDALDQRADCDRQNDGREAELEEELGVDAGVGARHGGEGCKRIAEPAHEESGRTPKVTRAAEAKRKAARPEGDRRDRRVDKDLGDDRTGVLATDESDFESREAREHEEHHEGAEQHPKGVGGSSTFIDGRRRSGE